MSASNAIVNAMLGWLKGLASWVLRLFNLSGGVSPLRFLANNWLKLLILLLIVGMLADLLIWLIRWRPHWVWFHKKRVIINDKDFFAAENEVDDEDDWEMPRNLLSDRGAPHRRDWQDEDYVVASAAHRRRDERERERERERRRRESEERAQAARALDEEAEGTGDVFTDAMFNVNAKQRFSDRYEDEVFSVRDLPQIEDGGEAREEPVRRARNDSNRGRADAREGHARRERGDSNRRRTGAREERARRARGDSNRRRDAREERERRDAGAERRSAAARRSSRASEDKRR